MNDAEFEAQKGRLRELAQRWAKPLGLGWWEITHEYARDGYEPPKEPADGAKSVAHCKPDWRYAHALIVWNMAAVADTEDEELEYIFVHELMHIFLHEMRWYDHEHGLDHEERVATTLAKAFLWLRDELKGED